MNRYDGVLNIKKMNDIEKRAYKSWKDQGQRCSNKNNPRYYCYGAVGIKREYCAREFIWWYVNEFYKRDKWIRPNVDRIDPKKNYSFDNIRLIECSENVSLRNEDHGNPSESNPVYIKSKSMMIDREFESLRVASRETGLSRRRIRDRADGMLKRKPNDDLIITWISKR